MRPSVLTKRDLQVLTAVFGFGSIEEFNVFLARQDALMVRDRRGRYREQEL